MTDERASHIHCAFKMLRGKKCDNAVRLSFFQVYGKNLKGPMT